MRLIATLLLTVLCFGLSAADVNFSAADLTAIAEKAKTMKVGEASSVKVMVDGKAVYVGVVMGANGVTVAGEGIQGATLKFAFTDHGLAVQATQAGQPTKTVLVRDNRIAAADSRVSGAFGAGAVSTFNYSEKVQEANRQLRSDHDGAKFGRDLNSAISIFIGLASTQSFSNSVIPLFVSATVTQNNSNQQAVIASNASGAPNP